MNPKDNHQTQLARANHHGEASSHRATTEPRKGNPHSKSEDIRLDAVAYTPRQRRDPRTQKRMKGKLTTRVTDIIAHIVPPPKRGRARPTVRTAQRADRATCALLVRRRSGDAGTRVAIVRCRARCAIGLGGGPARGRVGSRGGVELHPCGNREGVVVGRAARACRCSTSSIATTIARAGSAGVRLVISRRCRVGGVLLKELVHGGRR